MGTVKIMRSKLRQKTLAIFLLICLLYSLVSVEVNGFDPSPESSCFIAYDKIIQDGMDYVRIQQNVYKTYSEHLISLEKWYNLHPFITYASLIGTSITIKFIDGSYTVLINPDLSKPNYLRDFIYTPIHKRYKGDRNTTAVILNPAEHMYGHYQCKRIISIFLRQDYSLEYLANKAVNLNYIRSNLSVDIIFINTHAGYFDIDGDQQADTVVIATGEFWTNETEEKYSFDYQHNFIVKGLVGNQAFVAFTPAFIEYYYSERAFPDSLVFMATCYALYDSSMAEKFLDAGARVYMGWSNNTVFWINSRTSVLTFRLLSYGLTIQQVCRLIRSGGFYNWLLHSKLVYNGDGDYRIP